MNTVLFLCTGNYYRSRFAEIFFNWQAVQRGASWKAESRGLALDRFNPGAMSSHTLARLKELGIACDTYLRHPRDVCSDDFSSAHHIVAVKRTEHRPMIESRFPGWVERVEFWEVHDLDYADPSTAIPHLEREVLGLLDRLASKPA
jgi:protein-tyrosine phosphatase